MSTLIFSFFHYFLGTEKPNDFNDTQKPL